MIDYKLAKEIGATHYHFRTGEMYRVEFGVLLVFRLGYWINSGLPLDEAASKVKPIPPKARTRTEYEKVTESIFDLRDEFERGELYFKYSQGIKVIKTEQMLLAQIERDGVYRKAEKEIDGRQEFIDAACSVIEDYHGERRQYVVEALFDSGKFKLIG